MNMWAGPRGEEQLVVFPLKPTLPSALVPMLKVLVSRTSDRAPAAEDCSPLHQTSQQRPPIHEAGRGRAHYLPRQLILLSYTPHMYSQTHTDLLPLSEPVWSTHAHHRISMCTLHGENKHLEAMCRHAAPTVLWDPEPTWLCLQDVCGETELTPSDLLPSPSGGTLQSRQRLASKRQWYINLASNPSEPKLLEKTF